MCAYSIAYDMTRIQMCDGRTLVCEQSDGVSDGVSQCKWAQSRRAFGKRGASVFAPVVAEAVVVGVY